MIKINGQDLPIPSSFEYQFSDIDKDSGRNDLGYLQRERLGSKVKLTISWNAANQRNGDMVAFLKNLDPFVYVTYPDPDGSTRTMEAYRGDIKGNMYKYDQANGNIWKEFSCSFIER